ncbi:MAG TPA: ABC transporter permease [Bdellovibrionales bacterium]|nr:ABC transporter permease [Bdellovibrionales bacterium]
MREGLVFSAAGLLLGFAAAAVLSALLGESPWLVLTVLVRGSVGSLNNLAYSLYYATPLIFTGLAVAWAFHARLFNIGAEGQMAIGGLAAVSFGLTFPELPSLLAIPGALLSAMAAAGFWGAIAGYLKAYRKVHEVLATIMLNFIAYGIVSYAVSELWRNTESQAPETRVLTESYRLPQVMDPLNFAILAGLAVAALFTLLLFRSRFGFYQRMIGGGPKVARLAGLNVERHVVAAMFVSGALAGLAGISDILGFSLKLREGFTGGAGFIGIAVALLGRNSALGVILAAVLFGSLHKGSLDLDLDTDKISRDLSVVIQAFVIIFVASSRGLADLWAWARKPRGVKEESRA